MMRWVTLPVLIGLATACGGTRSIAGIVVDADGQPLNRAIISLQPGDVELITDREGQFIIDYLRDSNSDRTKLANRTNYTLEVFKPGFDLQSQAFYYKRGTHLLGTIALTPDVLRVQDDGQNLVPHLGEDRTTTGGAAYEGQ